MRHTEIEHETPEALYTVEGSITYPYPSEEEPGVVGQEPLVLIDSVYITDSTRDGARVEGDELKSLLEQLGDTFRARLLEKDEDDMVRAAERALEGLPHEYLRRTSHPGVV